MANTIRHKRSSISEKVPEPNDLALGELAINTTDIALYTKTTGGDIAVINSWENILDKPDLDEEFSSRAVTVVDTTAESVPGNPGMDDLPNGQWGVFFDEYNNSMAIFARRGATVYKWSAD